MMFKNKIVKLPDGENLTLFAKDKDIMHLYLKKDGIKKKKIILGKIVRCENLEKQKNCDCLFEISNEHLCLCLGSNMSIIKNENLS